MFSVQKSYFRVSGTRSGIFWHCMIIEKFQTLAPEYFKPFAFFEPSAECRFGPLPAYYLTSNLMAIVA